MSSKSSVHSYNIQLFHVYLGVGALYVRRRPRVRLEALQSGGGQERGLRSGTVPTPLSVGLGAACEVAQKELDVKKHPLLFFIKCLISNLKLMLMQFLYFYAVRP